MNYDSLNEIFSAGITNMTCLFQNSDKYDDGSFEVRGADFFTFMENSVQQIYAYGNSYWGVGKDESNIKINTRDTRMRSLFREEGTLYNYYKFLKIRWEGWSHHNSSGADYQLKYELIFWDTGDISLHMINVPLLCYDGVFELSADKIYSFTKPTSESPDITFQYNSESKMFDIKYNPIDLLVPFKLIIQDNKGDFYTIENMIINEETNERFDVLVKLKEPQLNALLFKTKGFAKMPDWDLIKELDTPSILSWSESRAFPLNAVITGTPPKQYVECTANLSDETVLGIKALNAEYSGTVTEQHSFDGENFSEEISLSEFLTSDTQEIFNSLTERRKITFRFWLEGDATLTTFVMTYRNGDDDDVKQTDGNN